MTELAREKDGVEGWIVESVLELMSQIEFLLLRGAGWVHYMSREHDSFS